MPSGGPRFDSGRRDYNPSRADNCSSDLIFADVRGGVDRREVGESEGLRAQGTVVAAETGLTEERAVELPWKRDVTAGRHVCLDDNGIPRLLHHCW